MTGLRHYKLVGHEVVAVDMREWAISFNSASRRVAFDLIGEGWISTVFVGLENDLFETVIFRPGGQSTQFGRWSTWDYAEAGHAEAVAAERLRLSLGADTA